MPLNWALSSGGTTVNYGNGSAFSFGDNKFQAAKLTMPNLADTLARFVDRPVVDMTGLKGSYDFSFEFQLKNIVTARRNFQTSRVGARLSLWKSIRRKTDCKCALRNGKQMKNGTRGPSHNFL